MSVVGLGGRGAGKGTQRSDRCGQVCQTFTAQGLQEVAHLVGKAPSGRLMTSVRKLTQQAAVGSVETKGAQDPGHRSKLCKSNLCFRGHSTIPKLGQPGGVQRFL